jgi:uncharacterized protein YukE
MAMGSTGTVNISPEMMQNAIKAIGDYRDKTNQLHDTLTSTVNDLIPGSFSGSAADGFKFFYDDKIEPAVGDGLTKMLQALEDICDATLKAIPDNEGLDEKLSEENRK